MRKDIIIDIHSGGFVHPSKNNEVSVAYQIENKDGEASRIYLTTMIKKRNIEDDINVFIPYIPIESVCMLRVGFFDDSGNEIHIRNPKNNSFYFEMQGYKKPIVASELPLINRDGLFTLRYNQDTGGMEVYDMVGFDFEIKESLYQDAMLLMQLVKGGYLKHPSSGVGIQNYFNSPAKTQELGRMMIDELEDDGIRVINADIDNDNGTLISLDVDEIKLGYEEQ